MKKVRQKRYTSSGTGLIVLPFPKLLGIVTLFLIALSLALKGFFDLRVRYGASMGMLYIQNLFKIQHVEVQGHSRTPLSQIKKQVLGDEHIPWEKRVWILKERLEGLPWIQEAVVERRYPQALFVSLTEYVPLAVWHHGGRKTLLSDQGHFIPVPVSQHPKNLWGVLGADVCQRAPAFTKTLQQFSEVAEQVRYILFHPGGGVDLRLKNGCCVKVSGDNMHNALQRVLSFYKAVGFAWHRYAQLDFRIADRVIIQYKNNKRTQSLIS